MTFWALSVVGHMDTTRRVSGGGSHKSYASVYAGCVATSYVNVETEMSGKGEEMGSGGPIFPGPATKPVNGPQEQVGNGKSSRSGGAITPIRKVRGKLNHVQAGRDIRTWHPNLGSS